MKNEKLRSKHQKALLELRQQAVKEKTDAKLQWIDIKKRFVVCDSTIYTTFSHFILKHFEFFSKFMLYCNELVPFTLYLHNHIIGNLHHYQLLILIAPASFPTLLLIPALKITSSRSNTQHSPPHFAVSATSDWSWSRDTSFCHVTSSLTTTGIIRPAADRMQGLVRFLVIISRVQFLSI